MIRISIDNYRYVMVVNSKLTKSVFLDKCGACKGYARNVFSRFYDSIFSEAIYVKDMYEEYYAIEYGSYEKFLIMHYGLTRDWYNELAKVLNSNPDNILIEYSTIDYGDNGADDLIFSEVMRDKMINVLLMK